MAQTVTDAESGVGSVVDAVAASPPNQGDRSAAVLGTDLFPTLRPLLDWIGRHERTLWTTAIAVNLLVYLCISVATPDSAGDTVGYLDLTEAESLPEWIQKARAMWRPWFVPAFFSLFGSFSLNTAVHIMLAQTVLLFAAWMLLGWVLAQKVGGIAARLVFAVVALMPYSGGYYWLNHYILSDSIGLSVLLSLWALCIAFDRVAAALGSWRAVLLVTMVGMGAAGARDSNVMLVAVAAILVISVHRRVPKSWAVSVLLLMVAGAQFAQGATRHMVNMRNILAGFVLPNPAVREYFAAHGVSPQKAPDEWPAPQPWGSADYPSLVKTERNIAFADSDVRMASRIYYQWVLTHPMQMMEYVDENVDMIWGHSFARPGPLHPVPRLVMGAVGPESILPSVANEPLMSAHIDWIPVRIRLMLASLLMVGVVVWRRRITPAIGAAVFFLILGGAANAVVAFFSDLWEPSEMARHALIGTTLFNLGTAVGIVVLGTEGVRWLIAVRRFPIVSTTDVSPS